MKCIEVEESVARMFGVRENFAIVPNVSWGLLRHEADILVVRKSGYCIEVEIKVSKSDLKKDSGKRHGHKDWLNRIKELYFAVPAALHDAAEEHAPVHAGIILIDEEGSARIQRTAKVDRTARPLTEKEMMQVARLGTMRIWGLKKKIITLMAKK